MPRPTPRPARGRAWRRGRRPRRPHSSTSARRDRRGVPTRRRTTGRRPRDASARGACRTCRRGGCARTRRSTPPAALSTSARPSHPSSRSAPRAASPSSSSSAITGRSAVALASAVSSWISVRSSAVSFSPDGDALVEQSLDALGAVAEVPVLRQHGSAAAHRVVRRDDVAAGGVEHRRQLVERDGARPPVGARPARQRHRAVAGRTHGDRCRAPGSRCCRRRRRR